MGLVGEEIAVMELMKFREIVCLSEKNGIGLVVLTVINVGVPCLKF